jgi:hypothetical protein
MPRINLNKQQTGKMCLFLKGKDNQPIGANFKMSSRVELSKTIRQVIKTMLHEVNNLK